MQNSNFQEMHGLSLKMTLSASFTQKGTYVANMKYVSMS